MIAFTEIEEDWERQYLKKRFLQGSKILFFKKTAEECRAELRQATVLSVFIKSKVDKAFLAACPKLRCIATRSTGFDHIDLQEAAKRGITVSNVPVYGENTVAEHTFALILSLSRNLKKAYLRAVQNNFSIEGLMGFDLKGRTLGVVGTGHIGLHVIRMGVGFGLKVLASDLRRQGFLSEVLNFEYVPLEELLERSDIVTLHVPYAPKTRHLINRKNIVRMRKGSILINTARGGLVETDALVRALDKGILAGAGLDVLEEEETILEEKRFAEIGNTEKRWSKLQIALKNHLLLHRENVIYTPHMAFCSREAVERILETTVGNISSFLEGDPVNKVS